MIESIPNTYLQLRLGVRTRYKQQQNSYVIQLLVIIEIRCT